MKPIYERARLYALLMRLDRPIGILLLLWPTLWALWIASGGNPDPMVLTVFVGGVVLMRSAGCVINDFADRDIDAHVWRTRDRPLAAGRIAPKEAIVLFVILAGSAFALVLLMNSLTIRLSFVGVGLAATYPFMKRYTHLPQAYLGLAFGWGVPMAFAAQTGEVPVVAWLLLLATLFWAVAYDTMYAIADREDDLKIGVKSTAILFGNADRLVIGVIQLSMLGILVVVGHSVQLGPAYYASLLIAIGLGVYQQMLIKDREPMRCLRAFKNNNWVGVSIFCGLALDYLLRG